MFVVLFVVEGDSWAICVEKATGKKFASIESAKEEAAKYVKRNVLRDFKAFIVNTDSHGAIVSHTDRTEPPIVWS